MKSKKNIFIWRQLKMSDYIISRFIKKLRQDYDYTIEDISKKLGISKAAVSKWENGYDISVDHLYALSKIYDVSMEEMYNGAFKDEDEYEFLKRNCDLQNYDIKSEIKANNMEKIKEFFDCCSFIRKCFFELLPKWAYNELEGSQLEEFNFLKQYFEFDERYYMFKINEFNKIYISDYEKDFVKKIINETKDLKRDDQKWELSKIYNFTYDIGQKEVCESNNMTALGYMLSLFSQIEKDRFLFVNLNGRTSKEVGELPFFSVILNSGANKLYEKTNFGETYEREMVNLFVGDVREIKKNLGSIIL